MEEMIVKRNAVTVIELLFAAAILAILAGLAMGAYSSATVIAKEHRTVAVIAKIDQHLRGKWDGYGTRAVPIRVTMGADPAVAGRLRLYALRELMRCEMPDRKSDVMTSPTLIREPALQRGYRRRATPTWTEEYEGSECLYLILATIRDGEDGALDWFAESETTASEARKQPPEDIDGDGMPEMLDSWGRPIEFIRWPRGFVLENECITAITSDSKIAPDPFDPLHCDPRWSDTDPNFAPFALLPLVFSTRGQAPEYDAAFPTEPYAIRVGRGLNYASTTPPNDPYHDMNPPVGAPLPGRFVGGYLTNQR